MKVNDGPDLVHRPQGERYNPHCMSTIEGQLDGLHYQNILQNVMVPSVWMLYPEVIIHLQQDHSSIHDSSSSVRNTHHSQRTSMPPVGFEPTISAGEGP